MDERIEKLITDLPDPDGARRFLDALAEKHPAASQKLRKNAGLLSDTATIASFSPLLATTLLQNPDYLWWLDRERKHSAVTQKDDLVESLARFSLTQSQLDAPVLFARFRRRELLRIYLRDVRRLATIAEITVEISNLADAILETALKLGRREMDNRYGLPQQLDEKQRAAPAEFAIVALGKLGSRELNYSSDIDLLFLYSAEGSTAGSGVNGDGSNPITNREYFIKLGQYITKLVGSPGGEGGAYRVDLRLRPHGTMGPLALSVADAVRYYQNEARAWERQVLIRSRTAAGDPRLFRSFFAAVEDLVFSTDQSPEEALENVRRSKALIDDGRAQRGAYDVKLGAGGIREIEFLSQALQLAHGGGDKWLRNPHTLISLSRLADRGHISRPELADLSAAYELLRRSEHVLQMENGLQTHSIPHQGEKRSLLARRMEFLGTANYYEALAALTQAVSRTFTRVFQPADAEGPRGEPGLNSLAAGGTGSSADGIGSQPPAKISGAGAAAPATKGGLAETNFCDALWTAVVAEPEFSARLGALRRIWSTYIAEIKGLDRAGDITLAEAKRLQTELAEATINTALVVTLQELESRVSAGSSSAPSMQPTMQSSGGPLPLNLAVLALGKLGARGLDYGSDLDLVIVYDDARQPSNGLTCTEYYSRAVEIFVNVLSSVTRDGTLYRVDLRLRPYGSKGLPAISDEVLLKYMAESAAIWEMLAFVNIRFVAGSATLGSRVEQETRRIIHERAAAIDRSELAAETRRVRLALEKQHRRAGRGAGVDIKYGAGGILDIYFAVRYLQLLGPEPDDSFDRSTQLILDRLGADRSLAAYHSSLPPLALGYKFLSGLDHTLRLVVGRTPRLPSADHSALDEIARLMGFDSPPSLIEELTLHRLAVREAFNAILAESDRPTTDA